MKQFVVTLGRQFGSMGRSIARALSEELGVEYYDRDIVEQVTRELGITREEVDLAEGPPSPTGAGSTQSRRS